MKSFAVAEFMYPVSTNLLSTMLAPVSLLWIIKGAKSSISVAFITVSIEIGRGG